MQLQQGVAADVDADGHRRCEGQHEGVVGREAPHPASEDLEHCRVVHAVSCQRVHPAAR